MYIANNVENRIDPHFLAFGQKYHHKMFHYDVNCFQSLKIVVHAGGVKNSLRWRVVSMMTINL